MEIIKFGADDLENRLAADPSRAELLPFGAIMLDQQGDVLRYNHVESGITGRSAAEVVGKNFFNDLAPLRKGAGLLQPLLPRGRRRPGQHDVRLLIRLQDVSDERSHPHEIRRRQPRHLDSHQTRLSRSPSLEKRL